jgi:hypothetical protein
MKISFPAWIWRAPIYLNAAIVDKWCLTGVAFILALFKGFPCNGLPRITVINLSNFLDSAGEAGLPCHSACTPIDLASRLVTAIPSGVAAKRMVC